MCRCFLLCVVACTESAFQSPEAITLVVHVDRDRAGDGSFALSVVASRPAEAVAYLDGQSLVLARASTLRTLNIPVEALTPGTHVVRVTAWAEDGGSGSAEVTLTRLTFDVVNVTGEAGASGARGGSGLAATLEPGGASGPTDASGSTGAPVISVAYGVTGLTVRARQTIDLAATTVGGAAASFSLQPQDLLPGLSFSTNTGRLSGTVGAVGRTSAVEAGWTRTYTVVAANTYGSAQTQLTVTLDLSDSFDDPSTLANEWTEDDPSAASGGYVTYAIAGSKLVTVANAQSLWYDAARGALLYKRVLGNFKATVRLTVTNDALSGPPGANNNLAGLFAGRVAPLDYSLLYFGRAYQTDDPLEAKDTVNAVSSYIPYAPTGMVGLTSCELRLCRFGNTFRYRYRQVGTDAWLALSDATNGTQSDVTRTNPLPNELSVGPVLHAYNPVPPAQPDMTVRYDYFNIDALAALADCESN